MIKKGKFMIKLEWQVMNNNKQELEVSMEALADKEDMVAFLALKDFKVELEDNKEVVSHLVTYLKSLRNSLEVELVDKEEALREDNKLKDTI